MNIICIIQARMGSTRLPGKVMLELCNKPIIQHVIDRVKRGKLIDEIIIGTTLNKEDIKIVNFVSNLGIRVFAGSSDDVLDRYFQIAKLLKPKHIVRITADCPCIDPTIIDFVLKKHLELNVDYTSNTIKETYPDGMDVEIFTFDSLHKAWKNSKLASEREHVTPYIRKNFKTFSVENKVDLSKYRLTIDRKEDYEMLRILFEKLYFKNKFFGLNEIIEFLNKNTDIAKINQNIVRNEGYLKSIKEDKILKIEYLEE